MSLCNVFTQFNKGFLSGAGFGLAIGLNNLANRMMFGNMPFPSFSCFGFGFNPFWCGNTFYPYFTPTPEINMPALNNNSVFFNMPTFTQTPFVNMDMFFNQIPMVNVPKLDFSYTDTSEERKKSKKVSSDSTSRGNGTHLYSSLSRSEALEKAKNDSNLEDLRSGGEGWKLGDTFKNDIPFAKKGTGKLLTKASEMVGQQLIVTSALGTKGSPHNKEIKGSDSHYNESNPKLDLGGGMSHDQAEKLKDKLIATGLFSRVAVESDGNTSHLDVQFKDEAYETV